MWDFNGQVVRELERRTDGTVVLILDNGARVLAPPGWTPPPLPVEDIITAPLVEHAAPQNPVEPPAPEAVPSAPSEVKDSFTSPVPVEATNPQPSQPTESG